MEKIFSFGKQIAILILFIQVLLTSCIKEEYDLENLNNQVYLSPDLAIPLIYTRQTMIDVLESIDSDAGFKVDENSRLIYLIYQDELTSLRADEVVDFVQQIESQLIQVGVNVTNPSDYTFPPGNDTITVFSEVKDFEFTYSDTSQKLDSIYLDEITLNYSITNSFDHYTILKVEYPTIRVNDMVYSKIIYMNPNSNHTESEHLTNVKIGFDNKSVPGKSIMDIKYELKAIRNSQATNPGELETNSSQNISITFDNADWLAAFGYIGQHNVLNTSDSIPVKIFEGGFDGIIEFYEPELRFIIENTMGLPVDIELSDVFAKSDNFAGNPDQIYFENGSSTRVFNVAKPDFLGDTRITGDTINQDNSPSFKEALNHKPTQFSFSASGTVNPAGNTGEHNFVYDSSTFKARMELELPMHVRSSFYGIRDTFSFNLSDFVGETLEKVKEIMFRMETENGLPADVMNQVYFVDSNYIKIDSLFKDESKRPNIPAAKYDFQNHKVIFPLESYVDIGVIQEPAKNGYDDVRYIIIESIINTKKETSNASYVKFYAEDELFMKLGMSIKMEHTGTIDELTNF
ncbi:MAG: hypothetical protein ACOCWG_01110 [bacterium]